MAMWNQRFCSCALKAWGALALLALASCAEQGLVSEQPVVTSAGLDVSPFVGVYSGTLSDSGPEIYLEVWPAHPQEGYHFMSSLEDSGGKWDVSSLSGPVKLQKTSGGAMLVQVELLGSYWLDLVGLEGDDIVWVPRRTDNDKELKRLKTSFGLADGDGKLVYPLDPGEVVRFLTATKGDKKPRHFARIAKDGIAWDTYLGKRRLAREHHRYGLEAKIRTAQKSGGRLPGADAIATVVTMHEYGDPWATYMLARWHFNGWFVEKDTNLARSLAEQVVAAGYQRAENLLGIMARTGQPPDGKLARMHFRSAADAGEAEAFTNLALLDLDSEDRAARYRAVGHLATAAEAGEPIAADRLGKLYLKGDLVAQDDAAARRLFEIGADHGFVGSAFYLGLLRSKGRGGEVDEKGAVKAYATAAQLGSLNGKFNLALMYFRGSGTEKNAAKAVALFQEGADAGDLAAVGMLAYALETGQGIQRDDRKAAALYSRCAEKKDAYCQWRLGKITRDGRGVTRDLAKARALFEQAIAGGEERAETSLAELTNPSSAPVPGAEVGAGSAGFDASHFRRPQYIGALAAGRGLTVDDDVMGYLSGVLELYLPNCPWLGSKSELASVVQFYQATTQRALTNMFSMNNMVENTTAFASSANDGKEDLRHLVESYGCERTPLSEAFTRGLVKTATVVKASGQPSRFVSTCARSRLNEQQCTCLAELGRGVDPQIDQTVYDSRSTIKSIVNRNPMLGFTIGIQCGISNY